MFIMNFGKERIDSKHGIALGKATRIEERRKSD